MAVAAAPAVLARFLGAGILSLEQASAARLAAGIAIREVAEGEAATEEKSITIPVSSSAIRTIGYRPPDTIIVEFVRGGTYTYDGSLETFMAFAASGSKGTFFNDHFKK